ncbi:MAG: hypothetical protein IIX48_05160 [Lachnospiraceae bacterium]|nr:hypothetical protein [Lachnospiraceae bacterium]
MDILSLVIETVLAVLALIIAIIQLLGEKRARKEERIEQDNREKEKEIIGKILEQSEKAELFAKNIKDFKGKIDRLCKNTDNNPVVVMRLFDEAVTGYDENFNEVKEYLNTLYIELLRNEERFPMAYGYGRYISELRKFLDIDSLQRARRIKGYDHARISIQKMLQDCWENNDGNLDQQTALMIGQQTEQMILALEPYFEHADSINALLFELKTKYERLDSPD